jgi:EmrB/QacA subfamily drug resistance transporter
VKQKQVLRTGPNLILAVLALSGTSFSLLQSLVAPAIPELQHNLNTSAGGIAWLLTAFLLASSVATPIVSRFGDMFGKRSVLLAVLGLLWAGTLVCALANTLWVLVIGRVIQGAGGAVIPLSIGIIRDELPSKRIAPGIGLMSSILGVGGGLGIVLAGPIIDSLDVHWLFWMPLLTLSVAFIATWGMVPESPVRSLGRVNWRAALLLSLGLGGLLLAVSEGPNWGWASLRFWGLIAMSASVLTFWVRTELRSPEPLVDMRVMRLRGVWTTNLASLLIGYGMFSSFLLIPSLIQVPESTGFGLGASVTEAGLYMLPIALVMSIAGPLSGRLDERFGSKLSMIVGSASTTGAFAFIALLHAQPWQFLTFSVFFGIGIGTAFAAMGNLIVAAVPQQQTSVATGMNSIVRYVGGSFGSQIAASIIAVYTVSTGLPTEQGFITGFWVSAAIVALGTVVSLFIPGRRTTRLEEGTF